MKRINKIVISIIGIVLGILIIGGVIYIANQKLGANNVDINNQIMNKNRNMDDTKPSDSNGQDRGMKQRGERVDNSNSDVNSNVEPPEMENNERKNAMQDMAKTPEMNDDTMQNNDKIKEDIFVREDELVKLSLWYIVAIVGGALIFSASLIYLILDLVSQGNVFMTVDKIIIYVLSVIILSALVSFGSVYVTNHYVLIDNSVNMIQPQFNK